MNERRNMFLDAFLIKIQENILLNKEPQFVFKLGGIQNKMVCGKKYMGYRIIKSRKKGDKYNARRGKNSMYDNTCEGIKKLIKRSEKFN